MTDVFAQSTPENWKEQLAKDLKGITFEQLTGTDENGLPIRPFYTIEDLSNPAPSPVFNHTQWDIAVTIPNGEETLHHLQGGVNTLIVDANVENWEQSLSKDIDWNIIHSFWVAKNKNQAQNILAYWQKENITNGTLLIDQITQNIQENIPFTENWEEDFLANYSLHPDHLFCNGNLYSETGANTSTQISSILAHTNEYLNILYRKNFIKNLKTIYVSCTVGTLFFEEIAKLRALRRALQNILAEYKCDAQIYLLASTSSIYRAPVDEYSNLLRDTIAAMASIIGGCNSLEILPYSAKNGKLSYRMARNIQLILQEESYFNQFSDISSGSYTIEQRTTAIGTKAWEQFQAIENDGGLINRLKTGTLAHQISAQANQLIQAYKTGKKVLIGVNKYPNNMEPAITPDQLPELSENPFSPLSIANYLIKS